MDIIDPQTLDVVGTTVLWFTIRDQMIHGMLSETTRQPFPAPVGLKYLDAMLEVCFVVDRPLPDGLPRTWAIPSTWSAPTAFGNRARWFKPELVSRLSTKR